ncbi:MAG: NUDIX domain-containing protein [Pseudonocardia sp.]|nr:NUDIX domain-containing protein [Pseudonocardia sp.]
MIVVGAALLRNGRLLVAQRKRPPELAGQWELPGGRVEAGESEPEALVRECREELGADVRVTGRLGPDLPLAGGVLRVHTTTLAAGSAEPAALEHSAVCWIGPDELDALAWVAADRALVPHLRTLLEGWQESHFPATDWQEGGFPAGPGPVDRSQE